jgi:hypothetical protein
VIGDNDAVVGKHVTFWSAQWSKLNHPSTGGAPPTFKGFANVLVPNPPFCGGNWKSDPGNSSQPPAAIGPTIIAIGSSSITQSSSMIAGNIVKTVTIQVDPGYAPNPGHDGTGTVISINCQSAPAPMKATAPSKATATRKASKAFR